MARYRVVHKCFGFRGRMWAKDTIVNIDPSEKPPKEHFIPLDVQKEEVKEEVKVAPLSQMTEASLKAMKHADLVKLATEHKIEKADRISKEKLVVAILEAVKPE